MKSKPYRLWIWMMLGFFAIYIPFSERLRAFLHEEYGMDRLLARNVTTCIVILAVVGIYLALRVITLDRK